MPEATSGVWPAHSIVGHSLLRPSSAVSFWVGFCSLLCLDLPLLPTPNRSEPISHRSRFYVVLRGGRGDLPACFSSSQAYWACVGRLSDETVTHGFPSETEARIYVEAAGLDYPGLR